jgi:hypothetical protein
VFEAIEREGQENKQKQEREEEQREIVANPSEESVEFSLISHSHSEAEEEIIEQEEEDLHTAGSNESSDEEDEIEIVSAAMAKTKLNTVGTDISEAVLEPIWGFMDVSDPDYPGQNKPRRCWVVRVNIPAGVPLYSFTHKVDKDGRSVLTSAGKDVSRFEASYCMGPEFARNSQIMSSVQQALNEYLAKLTKHRPSGEEPTVEYNFSAPRGVTLEQEFRNPYDNFVRVSSGHQGAFVFCTPARSDFCWLFVFQKPDANVQNPAFVHGVSIHVQTQAHAHLGAQQRAQYMHDAYSQPQQFASSTNATSTTANPSQFGATPIPQPQPTTTKKPAYQAGQPNRQIPFPTVVRWPARASFSDPSR